MAIKTPAEVLDVIAAISVLLPQDIKGRSGVDGGGTLFEWYLPQGALQLIMSGDIDTLKLSVPDDAVARGAVIACARTHNITVEIQGIPLIPRGVLEVITLTPLLVAVGKISALLADTWVGECGPRTIKFSVETDEAPCTVVWGPHREVRLYLMNGTLSLNVINDKDKLPEEAMYAILGFAGHHTIPVTPIYS